MNYLPYLILLLSLSSLSLIVFILFRIMDYANVVSHQKIILYKIYLLMIVMSPFMFTLLRMLSWHTEELTFSGNFINQLSVSKISASLVKQQIDVPFCIFLAYGVGFFMMLSRILSSYLNARKKLAMSLPVIIQGLPVFLNKNIQSPLSFGLPIAKIYFPSDTEEKWTQREIQMSGYQGLRMELVARDIKKIGKNDAIGINYNIEIKNGKEKMNSKPHVIVAPNQEGRISLSSGSGHSFEMYVLVTRE